MSKLRSDTGKATPKPVQKAQMPGGGEAEEAELKSGKKAKRRVLSAEILAVFFQLLTGRAQRGDKTSPIALGHGCIPHKPDSCVGLVDPICGFC